MPPRVGRRPRLLHDVRDVRALQDELVGGDVEVQARRVLALVDQRSVVAAGGVAARPQLDAPRPVPERQLGLIRDGHIAARSVEVDRPVVRGADRAGDVARDAAERRPGRPAGLVDDRAGRLAHAVPRDRGILRDRVHVVAAAPAGRLGPQVLTAQGAAFLRRIGARVLRRGGRSPGRAAELPVIDDVEARPVAGADVQRAVGPERQVALRMAGKLLAPILNEDGLRAGNGRATHREARQAAAHHTAVGRRSGWCWAGVAPSRRRRRTAEDVVIRVQHVDPRP